MKKTFKRFCKFIQLKDDPKLIDEYKKLHAGVQVGLKLQKE